MSPLVAILFGLRLGLGAAPMDAAVASLREQAVAVAAASVAAPAEATPAAGGSEMPSAAPAPRRVLTREDWMAMLSDVIPSERLANAAIWIANQPLHVTVTSEKVFVSVRLSTP